jgi:hypothetical protein
LLACGLFGTSVANNFSFHPTARSSCELAPVTASKGPAGENASDSPSMNQKRIKKILNDVSTWMSEMINLDLELYKLRCELDYVMEEYDEMVPLKLHSLLEDYKKASDEKDLASMNYEKYNENYETYKNEENKAALDAVFSDFRKAISTLNSLKNDYYRIKGLPRGHYSIEITEIKVRLNSEFDNYFRICNRFFNAKNAFESHEKEIYRDMTRLQTCCRG